MIVILDVPLSGLIKTSRINTAVMHSLIFQLNSNHPTKSILTNKSQVERRKKKQEAVSSSVSSKQNSTRIHIDL